ncbi:hypothetical protein KTT_14000 [Tengunoibacter tsumagoiensis]|uniref:Uncharacterized protein n=1 Tax=Tengunoibacter tsumagoiensis TaxID=2014871 RepID=A0A401ZXH1_9CHLR|nr:hypothetical protein KTT_14000 [Tengunoibacter tsumagoiensis]
MLSIVEKTYDASTATTTKDRPKQKGERIYDCSLQRYDKYYVKRDC